jgi:hypothetical protein
MSKNKIISTTFLFVFLFIFVGPKNVFAFRFVSWADTKSARSSLAEISNQIRALSTQPVFTIYPGDLESDGPTCNGLKQWKTAINGNNNNGLFDITFSARGNHDARSNRTYNPSNCDNTVHINWWHYYFDFGAQAQRISGISNYRELDNNLTYSFDYGNSHFIGVDGPGNANATKNEMSWVNSDLQAAANRGLTHAFIFFHGPIYYIANHAYGSPDSSIVNMLNNNPIVSATFHGHEHTYAWVHLNKSRISGLNRELEQFVTGSAGAGPTKCTSGRCDFDQNANGFSTIDVNGADFTVTFYKRGQSSPTWSKKFTKSGGPYPTVPTQPPQPTNTPKPPTNTPTSGMPGDANGDDQVNVEDYVVWLNYYNQNRSGPSYGDFNNSGKVDGRDYVIWLINYSGPSNTPGPTSPQPTGQAGNIDHAKCNPDLGSSAFSDYIDNVYLPFSTGMNNDHVIYNPGSGERVRFRILSQRKSIPGADGVDPVTALVLEEYETVNGNWTETSQNWFTQTNDGTVCYLGEDTFKPGSPDGGAAGSWEAGKNGARAGIMMPPNPTVGQTWMIEDAPNDGAVEDAIVDATGVNYTTPAGTFSNTIYIIEDYGRSKKRYAPGIGMIFDDGMKLIAY